MAERRAVPQWQNGVVAVGARRRGIPTPELKGTAWLVDVEAGLICTCAHVVMDCYPHAETPTYCDASTEGVAIGVGGFDGPIRWWSRADLRYISLPPADVGYPHPLPLATIRYDSGDGYKGAPEKTSGPEVVALRGCADGAARLRGPARAGWRGGSRQASRGEAVPRTHGHGWM